MAIAAKRRSAISGMNDFFHLQMTLHIFYLLLAPLLGLMGRGGGAVTRLPWAPLVLLINLSDGQEELEYLSRWASGLTHGFGRILKFRSSLCCY